VQFWQMNIRYFLIMDRIKKGEMTMGYCPAGDMISNHFTTTLQGILFCKLRAVIMNIDEDVPDVDLAWERELVFAMP